jgi:hypothetical protein
LARVVLVFAFIIELKVRLYFILVGSILLLLGLYFLYRRLLLFKNSCLVEGLVVSYLTRDDDGTTIYYPKVGFTANDGKIYEFVAEAGNSSRPRLESHPVRVRYNPNHPKEAFIDSFLHFWAGPLAFIVLGVASVAVMFVK